MKGIKENASYYHDYFCSNTKTAGQTLFYLLDYVSVQDTSGDDLLRLWTPLLQAAFQRQIQRDKRPASPGPGFIDVEVQLEEKRFGKGSEGMSGGLVLGSHKVKSFFCNSLLSSLHGCPSPRLGGEG